MQYILVPDDVDDIMQKIGEWYASTYLGTIVPEYEIEMFASHNRLPNYLRFRTDKYNSYMQGDYIFAFPPYWIPIQVVLANVVLSASILKSDIPPDIDADGTMIVHRHPLPGMCSPEDCIFDQQAANIADVVWSPAYELNQGFVCGCSVWASEGNAKVVPYSVDDLECTLPQCTNGQIPKSWKERVLSKIELSKIVVLEKKGT